MPIPWNSDDPRDQTLIRDNLRRVLSRIVDEAAARQPPSVELARSWHRDTYDGANVPVPSYVGGFRGSSARPELRDYEVAVGRANGSPARQISEDLSRFEASVKAAVEKLDSVIPARTPPDDRDQLYAVLTLAAHVHGEWVRIHPFANGNGLTARLWANWCAVRYGLPPFVRLRPRPDGSAYARAAADSMRGSHRAMVAVFADMLSRRLQDGPS